MVWTLFSTFCSYSSKILFCILFFGLEQVYSLFQYLLYYLDSVNSCRTTHYPNSPQKVSSLFMVFFPDWLSSSNFSNGRHGKSLVAAGGGRSASERAPQRQSLNNHVSSAGLHYPPVRPARCQPARIAGWLWQGQRRRKNQLLCYSGAEWRGGRPSVSSGLPYPRSKWTRAARGEATDTHRAKPSEHNARIYGLHCSQRDGALVPLKHI